MRGQRSLSLPDDLPVLQTNVEGAADSTARVSHARASAALAQEIKQVFMETEGKSLRRLLQENRLKEFDPLGMTDEHTVKCKLAPSYGKLRLGIYKEVDEYLSVLLVSSINSLNQARKNGEELNWQTVNSVLRQNPYLKAREAPKEIYRDFDKKIRTFLGSSIKESKTRYFAIAHQVDAWFNQLVADEDVLKAEDRTSLLEDIQSIVARTSDDKDRNSEGTFAKTFLDVGVLRFPDHEHPYIRVYHIKLTAWASCERVLGGLWQTNVNGVKGEYHSYDYHLREGVLEELQPEWKTRAMREATGLLQVPGIPPDQ